MDKRFVSEKHLEEQRQAEWDRVKRGDTNTVRSKEPAKPLWQQLAELKEKRDADVEAEKAFKNQVRGIDDDEARFLSAVVDQQLATEKQKDRELTELIKECAKAQKLDETAATKSTKTNALLKPEPSRAVAPTAQQPNESALPKSTTVAAGLRPKTEQKKLLAGVVKRKTTQPTDNPISDSKKLKDDS